MSKDPDDQAQQDLRRYPRYATDLPVAIAFGEVVASESAYLNNISAGGMSFNSMAELALGTVVMLALPVTRPVFRTPGRVVWCRKIAFQHVIGVEFLSKDMTFRNRIVEMVRRIDEHRQEAQRTGRVLDTQQAALEWIDQFGQDFFARA